MRENSSSIFPSFLLVSGFEFLFFFCSLLLLLLFGPCRYVSCVIRTGRDHRLVGIPHLAFNRCAHRLANTHSTTTVDFRLTVLFVPFCVCAANWFFIISTFYSHVNTLNLCFPFSSSTMWSFNSSEWILTIKKDIYSYYIKKTIIVLLLLSRRRRRRSWTVTGRRATRRGAPARPGKQITSLPEKNRIFLSTS